MKLALVQMHSEKGEVARNLARIAEFAHRATAAGAEIACFPETSITGYVGSRTHANAVVGWGDPELTPLFQLSKRTGLTLVAGIVERNTAGAPFISQSVIRGGDLVGTYRKINLAPDEIGLFSPGAEPLLWRQGDVDFGVAVCADIESEGLFQGYARSGAKVVLLLAAPGLYGQQNARDWQEGYAWWRDKCRDQLGAYAGTYGLHIAVATQAGRTVDEDFPGGGYLFDDRGDLIAETAHGTECMLIVDVPSRFASRANLR